MPGLTSFPLHQQQPVEADAPFDVLIAPPPPPPVQTEAPFEVRSSSVLGITVTTEAISESEARAISDRVVASASRTHLTATGEWTWEQLRDYTVSQIEQKWGARPRDPMKEAGIFKGFISRWGSQAETIARIAFEVHGGIWNGAPVSVQRFCKGSDPYFAAVIAKNI